MIKKGSFNMPHNSNNDYFKPNNSRFVLRDSIFSIMPIRTLKMKFFAAVNGDFSLAMGEVG